MILKITFIILVFILSHFGVYSVTQGVTQDEGDQQCSDLIVKLQSQNNELRNVPINVTEQEFNDRDLKVMDLMNKKMRGWFE